MLKSFNLKLIKRRGQKQKKLFQGRQLAFLSRTAARVYVKRFSALNQAEVEFNNKQKQELFELMT